MGKKPTLKTKSKRRPTKKHIAKSAKTSQKVKTPPAKGKSPRRTEITVKPSVKTKANTGKLVADLKKVNQRLKKEIAEHKRAVIELSDSEERIRSIFNNAFDAIISLDAGGTISQWNRRAEITFGWKPEEAIGKKLAEINIPPQYRDAHKEGLDRFLKTGESRLLNRQFEITAIHRDGREFPVEIALSASKLKGSYIFTGIIHDISERKQFEEKLKTKADELEQTNKLLAEKEKRYRTIVETTSNLIFEIDPQRRIAFVNSAIRFLGYEPSEMLGRPMENFIETGEADELLSKLATQEVGPMATVDLQICFKTNSDSVLSEELDTQSFFFNAYGLWDVPDDQVYKTGIEKNFLGTLCIGRNIS